jgi:type II secretory pathway component GspD/PulD (secretin)
VIWLRNANASDIFTALNNLLNTQRNVITQQLISGQAISLFERVDREVFLIAEPSTNSIVVSATPRYMQQIRQVIERLDRQQPMVFVEMLIAEVVLDDQFEFGTELGLQDSLLFDRNSASGGTLGSPVFNVLSPAFNTGSPQRRPQNVAGQGSSGFALGRTSDLGYGGLVLAASRMLVSPGWKVGVEVRMVAVGRKVGGGASALSPGATLSPNTSPNP